MKIPSGESVAQAFLSSVAAGRFGCTTTLPELTVLDQKRIPKDNWGGKNLWVTPRSYGSGFWRNLPVKSPVVGIIIWCKPIDKRRHWGQAMDLAQELMALGTDWYSNVNLEMPYPGYRSVRLTSFLPVIAEPRRIENDPQQLAHVEFDVQLTYGLH